MKTTRMKLRPILAGCISACMAFAFLEADASFRIQIGGAPPPPPVVIERPWVSPSSEAVWVEPHYEWEGNQWVWIRGYYMYPPRTGAVWIGPRYFHDHDHHYYERGRWDDHGHHHR
ncbi:MAG: hypothetical protein V4507_03500 [Verrucomicrobiota bacterium]